MIYKNLILCNYFKLFLKNVINEIIDLTDDDISYSRDVNGCIIQNNMENEDSVKIYSVYCPVLCIQNLYVCKLLVTVTS